MRGAASCSDRRVSRASRTARPPAGALAERASPLPSARLPSICSVRNLRSHPGRGDPRPVISAGVLDRMTDAMTHRGPNDRGTYRRRRRRARRAPAQHRRRRGRPPAVRERGRAVWAIQNGELYNHDEVRAAARRREATGSRTRCDTEIIPHLYEERGPRSPSSCAACSGSPLWDGRERRAVLARDRLGIKPLYYAQAGDLLVFALRAEEPARQRPRRRRARLRGDRRLPRRSASSRAR